MRTLQTHIAMVIVPVVADKKLSDANERLIMNIYRRSIVQRHRPYWSLMFKQRKIGNRELKEKVRYRENSINIEGQLRIMEAQYNHSNHGCFTKKVPLHNEHLNLSSRAFPFIHSR